jgi:hypothetical protein
VITKNPIVAIGAEKKLPNNFHLFLLFPVELFAQKTIRGNHLYPQPLINSIR